MQATPVYAARIDVGCSSRYHANTHEYRVEAMLSMRCPCIDIIFRSSLLIALCTGGGYQARRPATTTAGKTHVIQEKRRIAHSLHVISRIRCQTVTHHALRCNSLSAALRVRSCHAASGPGRQFHMVSWQRWVRECVLVSFPTLLFHPFTLLR